MTPALLDNTLEKIQQHESSGRSEGLQAFWKIEIYQKFKIAFNRVAAVPDQIGLTRTILKSAGTCTYWPFWLSFRIFSSALPRGSIFTLCVGDLCRLAKNRDSFVEGSTDWVAWRAVLPRLRQPLWRAGCDLGDNLLVTLLQLGRRRLLARCRQRHCLRPGYQGVLLFSWMHCSRWFSCRVLLFPPSQGFEFLAAENFICLY